MFVSIDGFCLDGAPNDVGKCALNSSGISLFVSTSLMWFSDG